MTGKRFKYEHADNSHVQECLEQVRVEKRATTIKTMSNTTSKWLGVKCDRCLLTSDIVLVSSWYGLFEKMSLRTSKLASITSMLFDRSLL